MNADRFIIMAAIILALVWVGGPSATTAQASSGSDFANLCQAVGAKEGKISRKQFIAKAKDKDAAAQFFDACDANGDKTITEDEATPKHMEGLKDQAIRLTTP
jgi:hypothetical protein